MLDFRLLRKLRCEKLKEATCRKVKLGPRAEVTFEVEAVDGKTVLF